MRTKATGRKQIWRNAFLYNASHDAPSHRPIAIATPAEEKDTVSIVRSLDGLTSIYWRELLAPTDGNELAASCKIVVNHENCRNKFEFWFEWSVGCAVVAVWNVIELIEERNRMLPIALNKVCVLGEGPRSPEDLQASSLEMADAGYDQLLS